MSQGSIAFPHPIARREIPPIIADVLGMGLAARPKLANKVLIANNSPTAPEDLTPETTALSPIGVTNLAKTTIKVLIADDHPFVRSGIKQCINDSAGMTVIGEAGSAREVFEFLKNSTCDVLVLDIGLPDQSGLEVLRILKQTQPSLPILILTMYPEDQFAKYCLRAGAAGFLSKANASNHLVDAIREATRSGSVSPVPSAQLAPDGGDFPQLLPHLALSETELLVFSLIASGKTRQEIVAALEMSLKEVSAHRAQILKVMHMTDNAEIVRYALAHHLYS